MYLKFFMRCHKNVTLYLSKTQLPLGFNSRNHNISVMFSCLPKDRTLEREDEKYKPEDHWSCIAHLSAEHTLNSVVIEEKKFKHCRWAGADNPLGPKFLCQQEGLTTMVICCKFIKNLFNLKLYTHRFQKKSL